MIELERDAPDLEDLAAYLDGRLSDERRAQVEERLLRDEGFYSVFLESARFQQEQLEESGGGEVVAPAAWWRSWRVIAPMAVAASLVIAVSLWRLNQGPNTSVADLNASKIVDQEGWAEPGWTVLRSSNITQGRYQPKELAFRIGLRTVDLQVALAAGRRDAARMLTAMLEQLTDAADLFGASATYRDLLDRIESADFEALARQAAEIEKLIAEGYEADPEEDRGFALGTWTEIGRLAALAGDAKVLADIFRDRRQAQSIDDIAKHLDELEAIVDQSDPDEEDFEAAAVAFSKIVRKLAG